MTVFVPDKIDTGGHFYHQPYK
jgi:hypothetical protein